MSDMFYYIGFLALANQFEPFFNQKEHGSEANEINRIYNNQLFDIFAFAWKRGLRVIIGIVIWAWSIYGCFCAPEWILFVLLEAVGGFYTVAVVKCMNPKGRDAISKITSVVSIFIILTIFYLHFYAK